VVDLLLPQGPDELPGDLGGVAVAIPGDEAVARVARAVADVQVADVTETDDGSLRRQVSGAMLP